jgi:hypothetical protein
MTLGYFEPSCSSSGICGGKSDIGPGFLQVFSFSQQVLIAENAPFLSSVIQGWYNRSFMAQTPSDSPRPKKEKGLFSKTWR